jgi:hypothetical protein
MCFSSVIEEIRHYSQSGVFKRVPETNNSHIKRLIKNYRDFAVKPSRIPDNVFGVLDYFVNLLNICEDISFQYYPIEGSNKVNIRIIHGEITRNYLLSFVPVQNSSRVNVYKIQINSHLCDSLIDFIQYIVDQYMMISEYW